MPEASPKHPTSPPQEDSRKREPRPKEYTEYPECLKHPEPERLEGLMRNELAGIERRRLIRHLLTGCPRCVKVTRRCWTLGSRPLAGTADGSKLPE